VALGGICPAVLSTVSIQSIQTPLDRFSNVKSNTLARSGNVLFYTDNTYNDCAVFCARSVHEIASTSVTWNSRAGFIVSKLFGRTDPHEFRSAYSERHHPVNRYSRHCFLQHCPSIYIWKHWKNKWKVKEERSKRQRPCRIFVLKKVRVFKSSAVK